MDRAQKEGIGIVAALVLTMAFAAALGKMGAGGASKQEVAKPTPATSIPFASYPWR